MSGGRKVGFLDALFPIAALAALIVYGLVVGPLWLEQPAFPLEVIFSLAAGAAIAQLLILGFRWSEIQRSIIRKLSKGLPAFFILFAIGVIISSWMVSGTIPMLVCFGLGVINPDYLYLVAFVVPIVFSTLTGTSWGSAGSIGVVIIGIASALGANLGITAGAVIGGAYFGDKLSPLSDTTNLAALAAEVDLFDHIRSMMVTTLPSAIMASIGFFALGFTHPVDSATAELGRVSELVSSLEGMFHFSPLLLAPPAIVLFGSLKRYPPIPTLLASVFTATLLAATLQDYSIGNVIASLNKGFDAEMATWAPGASEQTLQLVNRGGLYAMNEPIFISFLVFFYVGAIDAIDAMPTVVNRVFAFASTRASTILAALGATAVTISMTSNQFATSFIVGDAFRARFDALRIPRKVLSRSLEDAGTMLESLVPWTTTAVFMVATLGVPFEQYWRWQLLSLINLILAPTLAALGVGCFYHEVDDETP